MGIQPHRKHRIRTQSAYTDLYGVFPGACAPVKSYFLLSSSLRSSPFPSPLALVLFASAVAASIVVACGNSDPVLNIFAYALTYSASSWEVR